MSWDEVGVFRLEGGRRVRAFLREEVDLRLARLPVLGPVLGMILRQRGRIVLHASAVSVEGQVAALVGQKGAGKSTTAAALHAEGHPLVTDDVLCVEVRKDGGATVWPGFPQLNLWPQAIEAVGDDPATLEGLHARVQKKAFPASAGFVGQQPLDLAGIYVLSQGEHLDIDDVGPRESFLELLRNSYLPSQLDRQPPEEASSTFRRYTRLAEAVPVRRLEREEDLGALPDIAEAVEHDVQSIVSSPSLKEPRSARMRR